MTKQMRWGLESIIVTHRLQELKLLIGSEKDEDKDIYDLYEGLYEISQDKELKFGIRISYTFAKNKNLLQPYYDAIVDTRQKILEKYGEPQDNGDWHVNKEKMEVFMSEWNAFMEIENFVNLEQIKIEDLEGEKIGVNLMEKLLPIINK